MSVISRLACLTFTLLILKAYLLGSLSHVDIWSCNFKEKYTKSPDNQTSSREGRLSPSLNGFEEDNYVSQQVDKSVYLKGKEYTPEEDALIFNLKEIEKLSWPSIATHFPKRTQIAQQVR